MFTLALQRFTQLIRSFSYNILIIWSVFVMNSRGLFTIVRILQTRHTNAQMYNTLYIIVHIIVMRLLVVNLKNLSIDNFTGGWTVVCFIHRAIRQTCSTRFNLCNNVFYQVPIFGISYIWSFWSFEECFVQVFFFFLMRCKCNECKLFFF